MLCTVLQDCWSRALYHHKTLVPLTVCSFTWQNNTVVAVSQWIAATGNLMEPWLTDPLVHLLDNSGNIPDILLVVIVQTLLILVCRVDTLCFHPTQAWNAIPWLIRCHQFPQSIPDCSFGSLKLGILVPSHFTHWINHVHVGFPLYCCL